MEVLQAMVSNIEDQEEEVLVKQVLIHLMTITELEEVQEAYTLVETVRLSITQVAVADLQRIM
jgi:predicted RNA-binding protein with PUA-like domain